MSAAPTETGVGGLFDNIVGAVTSIASGGDPVSAAASLVPAVSLSVSPQATPSPNQTWQRWQQIHPGTPRSDYDNWWSQYGQSGGTINGAGVGDALLDALNMASSRDYTVSRNDSPASIAKKFGVSLDQLLNANPQKATTVVRGVRTWTDLSINEGLNLPKAGVRVGYVAGVGQALWPAGMQTGQPSIADLQAQGYVPTLNNCFAGEFCYIRTVRTPAGPATRTYTFASNDLAAQAY